MVELAMTRRANLTTVCLREFFNDGEPDPGAAMLARPGLFTAIKALENEIEIGIGNLIAGIAHHPDTTALAPDTEIDHSPWRGVLQSILQQVVQGLRHFVGIGPNGIDICCNI